jgi:hypothetical protein
MSDMTRAFPLSPGLVDGKHRRNMGLAIWEFLWFIEHVTSDEADGGGKFGGVVDFGNPISASRIARDISSNVRSVQKNIQKLVATGYVIRRREMANGVSFIVVNSKRWIWKRPDIAGFTPVDQAEGANDLDAGVRLKQSPEASKSVARRDRFRRSNKESKSRRAEEQTPIAISLPDWLPVEQWEAFLEMRRKIRKPLTDRGMAIALKKLDELRKQGEDPSAVLEQSIFHDWQSVYPVKGVVRTGKHAAPTAPEPASTEIRARNAAMQEKKKQQHAAGLLQ